jgi:hypothetical protein
MVERLVARGVLAAADYTALDLLPANAAAARERLPGGLAAHGFAAVELLPDHLRLARGGDRLDVRLVAADACSWLARSPPAAFDLVLAHAVLDVLDVATFLPLLAGAVRPGGLAYLSLCFDGVTALEPAVEPGLDARIEARYHATMDERRRDGVPCGDSRSGRHLLSQLVTSGFELVAAGGSDWVVFGGPGGYPRDEAFFLRFLVDTVDRALAGDAAIAPAELRAWTAARHGQIDRGELVWVAHNLDVLAQRPLVPMSSSPGLREVVVA